MINDLKITIIGCGNLGTSIAHGILEMEGFQPHNLQVTKRNPKNLLPLQDIGVRVHAENAIAAEASDIIILGVKPYNVKTVLAEIKPVITPGKQTIVSLATGITLDEILAELEPNTTVFRAMPNIAADIQESMTCICGRNESPYHTEQVKHLFDSIGCSITIDESLMEAATVLGACGIAYVLRFMRAMTQGGIQIGFDAKTASTIVNQTVKGAAELMIKKQIHPEEAIDKVTTPKGCTIVGLNEMEHQGFSAALVRGVLASYQKIEKI
ncbi:pyrroline-5-carboxylate reductase [Anditalea andensis]|uniref:Pyrroline-5-carboxylate reductase n=1 Tax=Anditalea andensis TaxID=1048983 RepID=A0A074LK08_9BACT|nr:pyrroline-5-carboxylate reductase [Anditalea andensis]KEO74117.1 pyrroline-5-carboxylate reductase [Anditalea andensis]